MLSDYPIIGFIPTSDADRAQRFYVDLLELPFVSRDQFALVVKAGGSNVRITNAGPFTPAPFTILGWEVPDIATTVEHLTAAGVAFARYGFLEQDPAGIWTAPGGDRIAWFQDPDGNVLSLSQHGATAA